MRLSTCCGVVLFLLGFAGTVPAQTEPLTPMEQEFFERKIRPILADHCYKCHSAGAEKLKGGLLLDSREGWMKGGATGPVIDPGNPEKSPLIQAVRYKDKDLQMPPNDKPLAAEQVADLEQWIKMGAPDPRNSAVSSEHVYALDMEKGKKHWAFQPVAKPSPPAVADSHHWIQSPIDSFILSKLFEKSLAPSTKADKVTLLRRAKFDLLGLPPTLSEVDEFVADTAPQAFARWVDRFLGMPQYGERWGRYWLDLAHYGDTRGQSNNQQDNRYLYSYTYRDYVIRSFNQDLPYDQFLLQQIAADKLNLGEDKRPLAALGFLTLGNRFNNQINDIIDDRIDLLAKSTMALTMACARCHDHKFDPIPTRDYYAWHGIFNSSIEPREGPQIEPPKSAPLYQEFVRELSAREGEFEKAREELARQVSIEVRGRAGDYLLAVHDLKLAPKGTQRNSYFQKRGLVSSLGVAWENSLKGLEKKFSSIFLPWTLFSGISAEDFPAHSREIAARIYANEDKKINPLLARLFATPPATLKEVGARYSSIFLETDRRWQAVWAAYQNRKKNPAFTGPEPAGLPDAEHEEIRKLLMARNTPLYLDEQRVTNLINRDPKNRNRLTTLARAVNDVKLNHPGSPPHAHVLIDADQPRDSYIFLKGNPGSRGAIVPRQFLEIISSPVPQPFRQGSGRLELAQAIANPRNPLTARVMVNRIWLHHFGEGLCRNPDDFGTRSEPPTHPELLDYLAARFMEEGWSIKKLHRLVMNSATYQQSSDDNPRFVQLDPDNRWLWQMNRRRLDFEALRDTILFIGGRLELAAGGPPVRLNSEPYSLRRSIYGLVDRNNLPTMFTAFDFANPDLTTGKRDLTIVPQQALFMMNSPLVVEQARRLAQRPDLKGQPTDERKLQLLYRLIYQRLPSEVESKLALGYLHSEPGMAPSVNPQNAWSYGYGEFDTITKRTRLFVPMTSFNNRAWTREAQSKDPRLGNAFLTAEGGFPGRAYAVIRRWTAPRDGTISIDATLVHQAKEGDGVMGRIASSRLGELGAWVALKKQVPTKLAKVVVKRGDLIDFIVEPRSNPKGDNFGWTPAIRMEEARPGELAEWNGNKDFSGTVALKPLEPWEKLAQVLLETNELTFVN